MNQEMEKVAKIANNGYGQVQKNAEKIEKSFDNLASKLGTNIEVNIKVKIEGIENLQVKQSAGLAKTTSSVTLESEGFEAFKNKVKEDKPEFAVSLVFNNAILHLESD